jgi:hypothetical protein
VKLLGACLAACVAAGGAHGAHAAPAGDRFVEVMTGLGLTDDSRLRITRSGTNGPTDLTFSHVRWDDHSLEGPSARYMDVRFGIFFARRPWLGVAVDFLHYKVFADVDRSIPVHGTLDGVTLDTVQPMRPIVQRYNVSNGVNLIPLSVFGRLRFDDGRVQPFLGLGVGPTLLFTSSAVENNWRKGPYEWGHLAFLAQAGVRVRLGPRWGVLAEYKRSYTEANGSVHHGSSRTILRSDHFVVGGTLHF